MIKLEDCETPFGTIMILKVRATGAMLYEQGGCCQSEADINGVSLASYVHAMYDLLLQANAQKILLIGCGGGTLGTMLARAGRTVTIVDVNPTSFVLARQYFALAENVECKVADGKEFLRSAERKYDAIVLDAYHGDRIPAHLKSSRFFQLLGSRLSPEGVVFANVHVKCDVDDGADKIAESMGEVWTEVRLLDSADIGARNVIVMAGTVSELGVPVMLVPTAHAQDEIENELAAMNYRTVRVQQTQQL
jgi:spermidine synthase